MLIVMLISAFGIGGSASAAGTVVVTPAHTQGWTSTDMRAGGSVSYIVDASSPYPDGALKLTTDGNNASKANYMHGASGSLQSVTELGYWTKQNSGASEAAASYQLPVDLDGGDLSTGFTYFVYEPYWNGTVVPGTWQSWDVDAGQFWSSRSFTAGTCSVTSGAGGPPFYTLAGLQAACPAAIVLGFGVNVGTYNLNYDVEVDGVNFNGTTYDFELTNTPTSKDDCKTGGWQTFTDGQNNPFKNQGDCIQFVNTGK